MRPFSVWYGYVFLLFLNLSWGRRKVAWPGDLIWNFFVQPNQSPPFKKYVVKNYGFLSARIG